MLRTSLASILALFTLMRIATQALAADPAPAPLPDAPKGWTKQDDDSANTVYRPDDLPAGQDLRITILASQASTDDFRKWFDEKVKSLQAGKTVVKTTDPHASQIQGTSALMQAIVSKEDDAASPDNKGSAKHYLFRTYLAANPKGRMEMIVLSVTNNDLLKKYGGAYKDLTTVWAKSRVANPGDSGETK